MLRRMYIIGSKIVNSFRELKADNSGNTKDCVQATPFGFEANPIKGMDSVIGQSDRYPIILGYIQKAIEDLQEGETAMISKDSSGNIVSKIVSKNDGKINIDSDGTISIQNGNLTIDP